MIGQHISHYKIIDKIGEGGMGVVYKAHDTKLDRDVALKFLPELASVTDEEIQRFIREAKTAASLNHPNICTIHEIEEHQDARFIAMEFVEGPTLKEKLKEGPLPLDQVMRYALQICEALAEAHAKGIVHRDIKPENIMIDLKGRVKVMDFGLAKPRESVDLTKTGSTVGTAPYMSPEQAKGEPVDHRTDIWSFGVILYEMLTGQRPFKSEYEHALIYSIINEDPVPLSKLKPDIPDSLHQLVHQILEKDPEKRLSNTSELNSILNQFYTSESARVTGVQSSQASRKQITLYTTVAAFIVLALFATWFWPQTPGTPIRSIAVLPLDNYSGQIEKDYFVDGMTEALIMHLSKIDELRVISRTSSMRYKNSGKSLPEIAAELNVDALIEGSVLRTNGRVRITAQLIDARDDRHIWAGQFDRDLVNVLQLQSEVAREIVEQVDLTLSATEKERLNETQLVDPETYELYLRGRQLAHSWLENDLTESIRLLQEVIALDPDFAPAYGAIGLAYTHLSHYRYPHDVWPTAAEFASQAIELEEKEANAHMTLGGYYLIYTRNWPLAKEHLTRAIELEPNSAEARTYYAWYLCAMMQEEKCVQQLQTARQLDPLSIPVREMNQVILILMERYDEAIDIGRSTLAFALENYGAPHLFMGLAFAMKGDSLSAVRHLDPVMGRTPHLRNNGESPVWLAWGTYAYAEIGAFETARHYLNQIVDITEQQYVCAYDVGAVYGRLGEIDSAFIWLDRSIEESAPCLPNSQIDPRLDPVRDDPRFPEFMEAAGFNL